MENKKRYPTLCSWCQYCITGQDTGRRPPIVDPASGYSTYCLKEHFDNDGKDNFPDKSRCVDFSVASDVTAVDLAWWPIAWAASEINRLELKQILLERASQKP